MEHDEEKHTTGLQVTPVQSSRTSSSDDANTITREASIVTATPDVSSTDHEKTDPNIVDWDIDDPANPMNWSPARKWFIIGIVSAITFNTCMAPTIFAPAISAVQAEFNDHNGAEASLLVSIYVIGNGIGPLFLGPASELYGRLIALNVANVVFTVAGVLCAVAVNIPMLLVFRLLMGLACAVPLTVGGGVIGDLIEQERRGFALSLWIIGPLLGPVVGPVAGGYISLNISWRWTCWLIVIIHGVLSIATLACYRETYAPRILELKARRLRQTTGNAQLRSKYDKGQRPSQLFLTALIRPTKILTRFPAVLLISLFLSVVYSYMYLLFTTFPAIFSQQYGFNSGQAGLVYLGLGAGFIAGQVSFGSFSDWYLRRQKRRRGGAANTPEDRLPPLVVGAFLLPAGLFWYGWAAQYHTHWIVPIVGTSLCGVALEYAFMPVQMYLIDAYTLYASSAVAASTVVRSIFGTCVPLAGPALYARLGLGWGNTLLGFVALAFAPISFLLLKYGARLRESSKAEL